MRRIWWGIGAVVLALVAVGFVAPAVVRAQLAAALSEQAGQPVRVDAVHIDWTSGSLGVHGLRGGTDLDVGQVEVELALLPLLSRSVLIERLVIADTRLRVEFAPDGTPERVGGIALTGGAEAGDGEGAPPWQVDFRRIQLQDVTVTVDPWQHQVAVRRMTLGTSAMLAKPIAVDGALNVDGNPIDLDLEVRVADRAVKGGLSASALNLAPYGGYANLDVGGRLTLDLQLAVTAEPLTLAVEGSARLEDPAWRGSPIEAGADAFDWDGSVAVDLTNADEPVILVRGDAGAAGIRVGDLFEAKEVRIAEFMVASSPRSASAAAVTLNSPSVTLQRNADGALAIPLSDAAGQPSESAEPAPLPPLTVGKFRVYDGRLTFSDVSVSPPARVALREVTVVADSVTTAAAFPIELTAQHREVEAGTIPELRVSARLDPPRASAALRLDLEHFELLQAGAYLGAEVERGRLTIGTEGNVGSDIALKNTLLIEGLKARGGAGSDEGLPLALALALLEDSDGRIKLDVPLDMARGELDVGLQDVIGRAVRGATAKAAMAYATFALQPLGGLLLAKDVAGRLMRPRFHPIAFATGSDVLDDDVSDYLDKVAGMLTERPGLSLSVCGSASETEVEVPDGMASESSGEQASAGSLALALASRRDRAVRAALLERGASSDQVFECRDAAGPEAKPQVTLLL